MNRIAWIAVLLVACIENNLAADAKTVPGVDEPTSPPETTPAPPTGTDVPPTTPPSEPCDTPEVLMVELLFPARVDCPWGVDDNLTQLNEWNRARVEEVHDIVLPDGAQMCDLAIHSTTPDMVFDDHVTITLDDVVLVGGGYGYDVTGLPLVGNLHRYDWAEIVDRPFRDRDELYWCLGQPESVCVLPQTEEPGPLDVVLSDAATNDLMVAMAGRSVLPFRLVTFGDDDTDDCAHSDLALQVDVTYTF